MKHRVKTVKFNFGKDANKMLLRKLLINFFRYGKLTTTEKKAKFLKSNIEKLVEKTKEKTEANKNYLLRFIPSTEMVEYMYREIGPACKDKTGGYVRLEKLLSRESDGASIAQVTWVYPVTAAYIPEKREKKVKEQKTKKESEAKVEEK